MLSINSMSYGTCLYKRKFVNMQSVALIFCFPDYTLSASSCNGYPVPVQCHFAVYLHRPKSRPFKENGTEQSRDICGRGNWGNARAIPHKNWQPQTTISLADTCA